MAKPALKYKVPYLSNLSEPRITGCNLNSQLPNMSYRALTWPHMAYPGITCPNITEPGVNLPNLAKRKLT